jgi:uncharacterized protein YraI
VSAAPTVVALTATFWQEGERMPQQSRARRSISFIRRSAVLIVAIAAVASTGLAQPTPVAAAGPKVVVIVGPTHSSTQKYIDRANVIAAQAASYGASVVKVYTPHATWAKVAAAAQGARLLVYLGHGNGWPSPWGPWNDTTKDGFGLNPYDGSGFSSPVKYYGESYIRSTIKLAPGAVVLLNHLCYASGNSEPGYPEPTWDVARQRVDNFAAGFLRAGAGAVIADGHTDLSHEIAWILGSGSRNLVNTWKADREANGHLRTFASKRTTGYTNYIDPEYASSGFYRALTTTPTFTVGAGAGTTLATVSSTVLRARTTTAVILRAAPSTGGTALTTLATGTTVTVSGPLRTDATGQTWAPVTTSTGKSGYIAAWLASFSGSAATTVNLNLRSSPSTGASIVAVLGAGTRVTVTGSTKDASYRVWFSVKTSTGTAGWAAAWLMKP